MKQLETSVLNCIEYLFVFLRMHPERGEFAMALESIGGRIASGDLRLPLLKEDCLKSLDGMPQRDFIQSKFDSPSVSIRIETIDAELLGWACRRCGWLPTIGNLEQVKTFADAFHGLAFAVRRSKLNRTSYSSFYFDPLAVTMPTAFDAEGKSLVTQWSNATTTWGKIVFWFKKLAQGDADAMSQIAFAEAGNEPLRVTSAGTVIDGNRRLKVAMKKNLVVSTEVVEQ